MTALEIIATVANVAVALTAIGALIFARRQIAISREVSARETYERYHETLLEYPEFATGDVRFEDFDLQRLKQYETFVLYTLMIGERIFDLFPDREGWHYSIKDDIRLHKRFIKSSLFAGHIKGQDWTTIHFIEEVLAEPEEA